MAALLECAFSHGMLKDCRFVPHGTDRVSEPCSPLQRRISVVACHPMGVSFFKKYLVFSHAKRLRIREVSQLHPHNTHSGLPAWDTPEYHAHLPAWSSPQISLPFPLSMMSRPAHSFSVSLPVVPTVVRPVLLNVSPVHTVSRHCCCGYRRRSAHPSSGCCHGRSPAPVARPAPHAAP